MWLEQFEHKPLHAICRKTHRRTDPWPLYYLNMTSFQTFFKNLFGNQREKNKILPHLVTRASSNCALPSAIQVIALRSGVLWAADAIFLSHRDESWITFLALRNPQVTERQCGWPEAWRSCYSMFHSSVPGDNVRVFNSAESRPVITLCGFH